MLLTYLQHMFNKHLNYKIEELSIYNWVLKYKFVLLIIRI